MVTVTDANGDPVAGCVDRLVVDGKWSCTPTSPLPEGVSVLTVTETDPSGNTISSDPVTVTVDTTKPTIDEPAAGSTVISDTPNLSGTAPADGGTVTVTDENGTPIPGCINVPVKDGQWSCTPTEPLPDGTHELTATETDPSGNTIDSETVTVTIDTAPPVITVPDNNSRTSNPKPPVNGTAAIVGNEITVTDSTGIVCTATVEPGQVWACIPTQQMEDGPHTLIALETDPDSNVSAPSSPVKVTIDTAPPAPPVVDPTNGSQVTGSSENGSTVTVVDESGEPVPGCTAVPVVGGKFSCTPDHPLKPGTTIEVTATDSDGNQSLPTSLTVREIGIKVLYPQRTPGGPQQVTGFNFNPGEAVQAVVNSTPLDLGTKTADANGQVVFNFVIPAGFEIGKHTATVTGAVSGTKSITFEVTAPPPVAPMVQTGGSVAPSSVGWVVGLGAILLGCTLLLGRRWLTRTRPTPSS